MDDVRGQPIGKKMAQWHFDDLSVCQEQEAPCENGGCAHARIALALDTLRQSQDLEQRSEAYDKAARQAVEQQLALAGHRLAAILNGVFPESSQP
jgi:hypothetical protein